MKDFPATYGHGISMYRIPPESVQSSVRCRNGSGGGMGFIACVPQEKAG
ncbi:hypothetical protein [Bacteroides gallinarum]|nr:hypothetical protein [Bacteroides gallinarum]